MQKSIGKTKSLQSENLHTRGGGPMMSREIPLIPHIWLNSSDSLEKYWIASIFFLKIPRCPTELRRRIFKKLSSLGYLKSCELISPHCWMFWRASPVYESLCLILTPKRMIVLTNSNWQRNKRIEERARRNVGGHQAVGEEDILRMKKQANIIFQLCQEYFWSHD